MCENVLSSALRAGRLCWYKEKNEFHAAALNNHTVDKSYSVSLSLKASLNTLSYMHITGIVDNKWAEPLDKTYKQNIHFLYLTWDIIFQLNITFF